MNVKSASPLIEVERDIECQARNILLAVGVEERHLVTVNATGQCKFTEGCRRLDVRININWQYVRVVDTHVLNCRGTELIVNQGVEIAYFNIERAAERVAVDTGTKAVSFDPLGFQIGIVDGVGSEARFLNVG